MSTAQKYRKKLVEIEARADFRNDPDPDSDGLTLGEAFNTGWFAALRAAGGAQ